MLTDISDFEDDRHDIGNRKSIEEKIIDISIIGDISNVFNMCA